MTKITAERPKAQQLRLKPARKDILIDGNGILVQIEQGPRLEHNANGEEVLVAYITSPLDSDFRYYYPELETVPNQYPELFRIESQTHLWQLLNDDSYCGAWLLYQSFDGRKTALINREEKMNNMIDQMKFRLQEYELEIFTLRDENNALRSKAEEQILKSNILLKKLKDQQPMFISPGQQGEQESR